MKIKLYILGAIFAGAFLASADSPYQSWKNGPPADENYFPLAVWMQEPKDASRYQELGINLYVALAKGPTDEQLAELKKSGMSVICNQNKLGLKNLNNPIIIGWMHDDEPDNTHHRGEGPITSPSETIQHYQKLRAADPTRPIFLNLGEGVAWDDYKGRGNRKRHPEDYPEYLKSCDIASYDIYPVVHGNKAVTGRLEFVGKGVERLVEWTHGEKPVWDCIECTHIYNATNKATPSQVRSEVWLSLVNGSRGLIYFVHQFKPDFNGAALLSDPEMMAAIKAINSQIKKLAPVLNSPTVPSSEIMESGHGEISWMVKHYKDETYLFTVNRTSKPVRATFTLRGEKTASAVEVLDESRNLSLQLAQFTDDFTPYEPHLYRVAKH